MDDDRNRDGSHDTTEVVRPDDGDAARPAKKPYKSPVISRHGNLRLMTQLE